MKLYPDSQYFAALATTGSVVDLAAGDTRQDLIRGDVVITSKMNLMVRYINETWVHGNAAGNFWGDSSVPDPDSDWEQPSKSFAVKLTNTLSSTAVNEFQFSRAGNDILIRTNPNVRRSMTRFASKFPTVFPRPEGVGLPTSGARTAMQLCGIRRPGLITKTSSSGKMISRW